MAAGVRALRTCSAPARISMRRSCVTGRANGCTRCRREQARAWLAPRAACATDAPSRPRPSSRRCCPTWCWPRTRGCGSRSSSARRCRYEEPALQAARGGRCRVLPAAAAAIADRADGALTSARCAPPPAARARRSSCRCGRRSPDGCMARSSHRCWRRCRRSACASGCCSSRAAS